MPPKNPSNTLTLTALPIELIQNIVCHLDLYDLFRLLQCFTKLPVAREIVTRTVFVLLLRNTAETAIRSTSPSVAPVRVKGQPSDPACYLARHLFAMFEKRQLDSDGLTLRGDPVAWYRFFSSVWRYSMHFGDAKLFAALNSHAVQHDMYDEPDMSGNPLVYFWMPVKAMLTEAIDNKAIKLIYWIRDQAERIMQQEDIMSDSESEEMREIDHIGIVAEVIPSMPEFKRLWTDLDRVTPREWIRIAQIVRQEELWEGSFGLYI